jgi:LmbE family N-acetylglucosaminyl deacetylase
LSAARLWAAAWGGTFDVAENVLVIAPHPDDESIGCGGTVCLHGGRGDRVDVVFLTSGECCTDDLPPETLRRIREAEAGEACRVLGVEAADFLRLPDLGLAGEVERAAGLLRPVLEGRAPGVIYLPHPGESHPDHAAALPIVRAALAPSAARARLPELQCYEVWSPLTRPDWVEDVSAVMPRKLRAVRCYRSQLRLFRYDHAVRGLNRYRGILAGGSRYAEAFVAPDNGAHGLP